MRTYDEPREAFYGDAYTDREADGGMPPEAPYDAYDPMAEDHPIKYQRKVRRKKHYLLRLLVLLAVLAGIGGFLASDFFAIDQILVEGNHYYADDVVINMAGAETGGNLFWGAGASEIEDRLSDDPYFASVEVRRKLPDTLVIAVEERPQIAAIPYGDTYIVIDETGLILRKSKVDPKLTLLDGLTVSKLTVGEPVEAEEATALDNTLAVLSAMEKGDLFFKRIDVSRVTIRAYIYDTFVVKGTPRQMLKAIESGDLQKVVNNLFQSETVRGTLNLGDHNYMSFSPDFS